MLGRAASVHRARRLAKPERTQRRRCKAGAPGTVCADRGVAARRLAAANASPARRRFAFIPSAQRRGVGSRALAVDRDDALLVVSARIGAFRQRALCRRQSVFIAVVRLLRTGTSGFSNCCVVARRVGGITSISRRACRCDGQRLSARHSRWNAAERRVACSLLARDAVVVARAAVESFLGKRRRDGA